MSKKVLLLGCSGEVGSRLALALLKTGLIVHGVRGHKPCKINHVNHSCIKADLLDLNTDLGMHKFKPEVLVHTAWITTPNIFWESPQNFDWVIASKLIIEKFKENGGQYLVVTSTCAEYSWDKTERLSEVSLENPKSIYGKTKLELLNWVRDSNIPFLWTRTFFQFGLNEPNGRLIPSLIDALLSGDEYVIRNSGDIRDFVYIKDVIEIMNNLINRDQLGVINIGTGVGVDIKSISTLIAKLIDREDLVYYENSDGPRSLVVSDTEKLSTIIENYTWTNFESAITETIESRAVSIFNSSQ